MLGQPWDEKACLLSHNQFKTFTMHGDDLYLGVVLENFSDFAEGCNFWALVLGREIIGICDALVSLQHLASIQQVYILSKHRAKGLAKLMLSFVITQLMKEFSCLTYIVSEKNLSSIKLAESLGFKKKIDLADVQIMG